METADAIIKRITDARAKGIPIVWASDFDGTLSPYVDYHDEAVSFPGSLEAVKALQSAGIRVCLISGRPVSYLRNEFGDTVDMYGTYGAELLISGNYELTPFAEKWQSVVSQVGEEIFQRFDQQDVPYGFSARPSFESNAVFVEEKPIALFMHLRSGDHSRRLRPALDDILDTIELDSRGITARDSGNELVILPTDFSLQDGKSNVMLDLVIDSFVIFSGDDETDEKAAAVVRASRGVNIAINNASSNHRDGTPSDLIALADMALSEESSSSPQQQLVELMHQVAAELAS